MRPRSLAALAAAITLTGCGEPKIDGSTPEAMKSSVQVMRDKLQGDQLDKFDRALKVAAFAGIEPRDLIALGSSDTAVNAHVKGVGQNLNGMTATEVIAYGDKVVAERQAREREQALREIQELREKRAKSSELAKELAAFEVIRSRFSKEPQRYGRDEPRIDLEVKNGTASAVSRAYFEGVIASPGRQVPWLKETFNYSISGGLEPGETARWVLAPNQFSEWGKVEAPDDAILTVTVTRLDGPDGEPLFRAGQFTDRDERRLGQLVEQYGEPTN